MGTGGRVLLGAIACLVAIVPAGCGSSNGATAECNESAALCDRRLDQVVFPGTHNSFAASNEAGWHFANQRYGIQRQLKDGVRAMLLDIHYGVANGPGGRVLTDFAAEGSDRNKVAQQVPAVALRVATRLAGPSALGSSKGTPALYLCHTLCELGAEPLDRELEGVRRFLKQRRNQVLILIVEDYVPPAAIEGAFRQAGLDPYLATLDAHRPLPTMGQLITGGHRLLVFAEEKGGLPAWYMPAFEFIQDTPLGAQRPGQLSCSLYRGTDSSPLLLINHWIPPFPPSPRLNAEIGRAPFLTARVNRCLKERGRHGAILAVDFYDRTAALAVARQLNTRG
jgi:hypothetical protein